MYDYKVRISKNGVEQIAEKARILVHEECQKLEYIRLMHSGNTGHGGISLKEILDFAQTFHVIQAKEYGGSSVD